MKNVFIKSLLFFFIGFSTTLFAQPTSEKNAISSDVLLEEYTLINKQDFKAKRCDSYPYGQHLQKQYPTYSQQVAKAFENAKKRNLNNHQKINDSTLRVPVVVHVVYFDEAQNLPDSVIQNQIERLNQDYNRKNPDTTATREIFQPIATSANIEFYLATIDPDGNPTNGIVKTQTAVNGFVDIFGLFTGDYSSLERVKSTTDGGSDPWPLDKYMNIWVCDMATSLFGGEPTPSILGIATPPLEAPNWPDDLADLGLTDGVVLHYQIVGPNNPASATLPAEFQGVVDGGRTLTHEVGHYLGLRHIGGDAGGLFGGDGCSEDDGISDTPNANGQSQQDCNHNKNSCVDEPIDHPDMVENFMDYSSDYCMNMFSAGQVGIMRAMLTGPRAGLLEEQEPVQVVADFQAEVTTLLTGESVTFTDLSTGNASSWYWDFGDEVFSVVKNPSHIYATAGDFTVMLIANNGNSVDTIIKENYIHVEEPPVGIKEELWKNKVQIAPNPASSYLTIQLPTSLKAIQQVTLYNALGEQVKVINNVTGQMQIEVADLANGLYFATVVIDNQKIVEKVLIQR